MSIQSTINQAWSVAGILAAQSPGLKAKGEATAAKVQAKKGFERHIKTAQEIGTAHGLKGDMTTGKFNVNDMPENHPGEFNKMIETLEKGVSGQEKFYEKYPSAKGFESTLKNKQTIAAMRRLQEEVERKRTTVAVADAINGGM